MKVKIQKRQIRTLKSITVDTLQAQLLLQKNCRSFYMNGLTGNRKYEPMLEATATVSEGCQHSRPWAWAVFECLIQK